MATTHCVTLARAAMTRPGSVPLAPRATASKTHPRGAHRHRHRRHPLPRLSVVAAAASPSTVPAPTTADAWEASSPMSFTASVEDALRADEVVVLGTRASLSDPSAIAALPPGFARAFPRALRDLKPGDSGAKRTLMLPRDDADDAHLVEVTIGVLPPRTTLSRHNCPAAPHALSSLLAGVSAPKHHRTLGIVAFLAENDHVVPAAAAAARAFPLYSAKSASGRDTPEGRGRIARRGEILFAAATTEEAKSSTPSPAASSSDASSSAAAASAAIGRGVRLAARVVDAPPATMDPDALVREAEETAARLDASLVADGDGGRVTAEILRMDALEREGFGGLVAVGAAAAKDGREPALVHLKYVPGNTPPNPDARKVALVGKGITFDTGGLQIKPRTGMGGMKTDLGGAAGMLGAFGAIVDLRPTHLAELHLVLCVAENAVGAAAFRPDDVVVGKSGKTMEINNTDAEGRLVLADGVAFASGELACDDIVDMATLTGAQMVATGRYFAGILSDDERLETACVAAGRKSGDLCHALPYAPEFFTREFKSGVADMKNSVKDRSNAQASCAGQFIANHLNPAWRRDGEKGDGENASDDDGDGDGAPGDADAEGSETSGEARRRARRWLHVDMAGPSTFAGSGRGTGFGVALLAELINGPAFAPEPR